MGGGGEQDPPGYITVTGSKIFITTISKLKWLIKSKQILKYEADDIKVKEKQKGDFNVSDFTYGLSAYLGYGQTSLYVKYDLNPMFKNNNIDQNNVSLGIRFDFN